MIFTSLLAADSASTHTSEAPMYAPLAGCNCAECAALSGGQFAPAPGSASALAATSAPASPANAVDALASGSRWYGDVVGGRTTITYSFSTAASVYADQAADFVGTLGAFSAADQAMTRKVLDAISAVCNVRFVEVPDDGLVRYAYSATTNQMGYAGFAYFPSNPATGGDVWLGSNQAGSAWDWYRPDLILHETLHAIGLKHPFEGSARLDTASDLIVNTVMSYSPMTGSQTGSLSIFPAEPMALDIAALQALYGAAATSTGDTRYDLASAPFRGAFKALWDAGGTDTLDASQVATSVKLDLREGGHSDIGVRVNANAYYGAVTAANMKTMVYTDTLTLANGTSIEKAIGTAFDDVFFAGAATRAIDGGGGTDVVVFAGKVQDYDLAPGLGGLYSVTRHADGATATLTGVERVEFSDANLQAVTALVANDALYAQASRLYNAALDRAPDQGGLIFQTQALQWGFSLSQLADNFMASPEFQARFGTPDNSAFVTLLYNNVLDRAPDAGGLAYHLDRLAHGATRADVLVGFSESPENVTATHAMLVGLGAAGMLAPV